MFGLNMGVQMFSHTGGDPFGPMGVKNFYKARNTTDMYIFMFVCLEFGAVWLTASEGCSTKNDKNAPYPSGHHANDVTY